MLVQMFPIPYRTVSSVTVFITARQWDLTQAVMTRKSVRTFERCPKADVRQDFQKVEADPGPEEIMRLRRSAGLL